MDWFLLLMKGVANLALYRKRENTEVVAISFVELGGYLGHPLYSQGRTALAAASRQSRVR
jgi:hypothetical protein